MSWGCCCSYFCLAISPPCDNSAYLPHSAIKHTHTIPRPLSGSRQAAGHVCVHHGAPVGDRERQLAAAHVSGLRRGTGERGPAGHRGSAGLRHQQTFILAPTLTPPLHRSNPPQHGGAHSARSAECWHQRSRVHLTLSHSTITPVCHPLSPPAARWRASCARRWMLTPASSGWSRCTWCVGRAQAAP